MRNKNITIDELAIMVQKGFDETAKKEDMDAGFARVDEKFEEVYKRLDRIENILIKQHEQRISRLEEALAMK